MFDPNLSLADSISTVTDWIDEYRTNVCQSYCTYAGTQWNIDPTSIANINGIITIGMCNSNQLSPSQVWGDYNNNMVNVTFTFMAGMAVSIGTFVQTAYQASWTHKANVQALTDVQSVQEYDFTSTLWPDPNTQY